MMQKIPLLYQRGLYLALGGLVVFLYGVLWLRKVEQPPRSTSEMVSSTPVEAPSMAFDVDSAKLLEALQRKRGVARALNLWTLLVVLLLGSGVVLSIQALRRRRWPSLFQYRSPSFAGIPALGRGGRRKEGVAAKPCRQGNGEAEHGSPLRSRSFATAQQGFGAVPPHPARWRGGAPHLRSPWSLSDVGRLLLLVVLMAGLLPFVHMGIMVWLPAWWAQTHLWSVVSMFLLEGWVVLLVWGFASSKGRSLASTVGRLLLLVVLMAGLLPFVHMGIMVWLPTWWTQTHLWSVVSMFLLEGWVVLLVWGFASSKGRSLASTVGLSLRHSVRATEQAMASYITCFPWLMGLLWLIVVVCEWFGIRPPLEPIHELLFLDQPPLVLGLTVALACVVGPIVEEIFFRGVLFTALRKRTSRLVAMAISSSAFAAAHTNLVGFLPILLLGCLLADCYERTGSLWASIAVHIFHNSLLIGVALTLKALLSP